MRLHLLVPDLWPPPGMEHACEDLRLRGLEFLLGKGSVSVSAAADLESWLCEAFGVARDMDWPVAPITLLGDGGDPGRDFWLRADPVFLRLDRGRLILADSAAFSISRDEADALAATLNKQFTDDRLSFNPVRPDRWYLRLPARPSISTRPLAAAAGRNLDDHLPLGPDAMRWHRLLNEVQMALHEHPVNVEREARGEPELNSVWFWGGGVLPERAASPFSAVWTDEPLAAGLARLAGLAPRPVAASFDQFFPATGAQGEHLLVLDALRGAARGGDARGWRERVQTMENDWFGPLATALQKRRLASAVIASPGEERTRTLSVDSGDLWKFWRGPRALRPD